jgi:hypothetical protein
MKYVKYLGTSFKNILMKQNINKTIFRIKLLFMAVVFIMTSCHSEYVYLDYEVHHGSMWNNEHTNIAFLASKTAYRSATGIAKFPDGGKPDYLLNDVGLYVFNPENQQLTKLIAFNELTELFGTARVMWSSEIVFADTAIYYRLLPTMKWDWYLKKAKNARDSLLIFSLKEKCTHTYSFNINEKKMIEIDSLSFITFYEKRIELNKADLDELYKKLSEVPLADWGLVVKEIYPKPDYDYIMETIYMRNHSPKTRRAVVEQIIAKMNEQEIKDLLKKMDEYKNSLEGSKKMEFEIYSKDIYERIQDLL